MSKRVISPLEQVVKQFKNCTDEFRPQCDGINFCRKDGQMKVTVCNGFVAGVATYEDKDKPDITISLLPACYDLIRLYGVQDLGKLAEIAGRAHSPDQDWESFVIEGDKRPPKKENSAFFDSNILKKVLAKATGRVETKLICYENQVSIEYKIDSIRFKWVVLGIRQWD